LFRNQTVSLGIEKNGGRLFRRPKLILSCSAEGKEVREMFQKNASSLRFCSCRKNNSNMATVRKFL
jgi:hypothetical protein